MAVPPSTVPIVSEVGGTVRRTTTPARSWLRPSVILPAIGILLFVIILLSPQSPSTFSGESRLTTYSADAFGARGVYDVLAKLGWQTSRLRTPMDRALDTGAVYVLLSPTRPLDSLDMRVLVNFVHQGGRLFLATYDSAFAAQFTMWPAERLRPGAGDTGFSVAGDSTNASQRKTRRRGLFDLPAFNHSTAVHVAPLRHDTIAVFVWQSANHADSATAPPLMLGRRVGRGHVVFLTSPMSLRNDALRDGRPALALQRAMEWLDPPGRRVIFDEYHQGFGVHPDGILAVLAGALTDTAPGRVALQITAAMLVLLVAVGVRAVLPVPVTVVHRRSPLEHVDALARAYAQIHATRLGARRLVHGLRRRHPMSVGVSGGNAEDAYLAAVSARYHIPASDTDALVRALRSAVHDEDFLHAGRAAGRIEHSILTQ